MLREEAAELAKTANLNHLTNIDLDLNVVNLEYNIQNDLTIKRK